MNNKVPGQITLRCLINGHVCLLIFESLSILPAVFYVHNKRKNCVFYGINEEIAHPVRLLVLLCWAPKSTFLLLVKTFENWLIIGLQSLQIFYMRLKKCFLVNKN